MSKLRKEIDKKDWKDCCGGFCSDCAVAEKYHAEYGKKKGKKKFEEDYKKIKSKD
ncbi:MAG: hypothetical protein HY965_05075 [Ignavibacteriales bacterium]|nr:hypothetical protein [Ignavibacteriales bacterium]